MQLSRLAGAIWVTLCSGAALATTYPLPADGGNVIGELRWITVGTDDTLALIARRYGVGYEEMILANPETDRWLPEPGSEVLLPARYILPEGPRKGIVINIAEMRLYYFPRAGDRVITYPVGIGREEWETPIVNTKIAERITRPVWYPPESIREEYAARGEPLPEAVPPGPHNPLGELALRLGINRYLIHGTNKPFGIGMRVTHGCIRLYPEHMEELFALARKGTPVRIIDQPYKVGWSGGMIHIESHPPEDRSAAATRRAAGRLRHHIETEYGVTLHPWAVQTLIHERRGVPWPLAPHAGGAGAPVKTGS